MGGFETGCRYVQTKKDNLHIDQTVEVRPNQFYVEEYLA